MDYATRIRKKVQEVFPAADFVHSSADSVRFEVQHQDVTFDKLDQLSQFFQTKNINFQMGVYDAGCETCGAGSEAMVAVVIKDIKNS